MIRPGSALLIWLCCIICGQAAPKEVIFCTYNVRNFLGEKAPDEGQRFGTKGKPEEEIAALISVIRDISPDILGVCEMGGPEQFDDFKKRLAAAQLGYTDFEYVQAADPERHLALLSRYPIVSRQSRTDVSFQINGMQEKMRRGILDVTIAINDRYQLRAVGVHLKSKLPVPEGEALLRRYEAQKLRQHLEQILANDPSTNLIAYGDFNDSKNEPMFAEITGVRGSKTYMADLWARDIHGDRWTHYWKAADQYTRIDYLFVSPSLFPEVVREKSRVYRSPFWNDASDHRPVYTSIVPLDKK